MKKSLIIIFLLCIHFSAFTQKANLIKLDALKSRIKNGVDTTYIINFWATWCSPCTKELPYFEKLNGQFKTEKLKVLLVSLDFKSQLKSSLNPFIKRRNLKSEVLLLDEKDPQQFINRVDTSWSGSIPATLIIKDKAHKFFEKDLTFDELVNEYKILNKL